jgi:hypothetical protein
MILDWVSFLAYPNLFEIIATKIGIISIQENYIIHNKKET